MAKRKRELQERTASKAPQEPKRTHAAYLVALWAIAAGLVAQIVMAIMAYPILPGRIPSNWIGDAIPLGTIPSWVIFVAFPGAEIILAIIAFFSPNDEEGRKVMESGQAVSLILLAVLFTALQASAFHIPQMR